jgi:hypothetical protein
MTKDKWSDVLHSEISLASLSSFVVLVTRTFFANLKLIILMSVVFSLLSLLYGSILSPRKHKAEAIIVTEEQGPSGWESLLAQFGLDVASSSTAGVFQGESLVKFFQTRNMVESTLLTKVKFKNDSVLLAQLVWPQTKHAGKKIFKDVNFQPDRSKQDAITDSALFLTYQFVRKKMLGVNKPDKKQSMIHVTVVNRDPFLARLFNETLVTTVSEFYSQTLTEKARENLAVLKTETDSVYSILNDNLFRNAYESDLNVVPLRQTVRIAQNRAMIDLQVSVALYGELQKNLKLAEISLRKETPLIQVIDPPQFPLERTGLSWWQWAAIGAVMGFLIALYLTYLRVRNG